MHVMILLHPIRGLVRSLASTYFLSPFRCRRWRPNPFSYSKAAQKTDDKILSRCLITETILSRFFSVAFVIYAAHVLHLWRCLSTGFQCCNSSQCNEYQTTRRWYVQRRIPGSFVQSNINEHKKLWFSYRLTVYAPIMTYLRSVVLLFSFLSNHPMEKIFIFG